VAGYSLGFPTPGRPELKPRSNDGRLAAWRFLADRAEAERAFALAERLGSVNAAAELGTTWPSLRKAFTRHGLGMPARNPQAVRQRAIEAARQRTGRPASPSLDPVVVALNRDEVPVRGAVGWGAGRAGAACRGLRGAWCSGVVELHSESHAATPTTRAWAITRHADRAHRLAGQRSSRAERRQADRTSRTDRPHQPQEGGWLPMPDDPIHPDQLDGQARLRADLAAYLDSLPVGELAELLSELPNRRLQPLQLGVLMVALNERLPDAYKLLPPAGHPGPGEGRGPLRRRRLPSRTWPRSVLRLDGHPGPGQRLCRTYRLASLDCGA
jgi:hypothetical protein